MHFRRRACKKVETWCTKKLECKGKNRTCKGWGGRTGGACERTGDWMFWNRGSDRLNFKIWFRSVQWLSRTCGQTGGTGPLCVLHLFPVIMIASD